MNKNDKIIMEFSVLWEGWECDSKGWVKEREDKTRYLVLTDHGSPYEAKPEDLLNRIKSYEEVIELSKKALGELL